MKLNKFLVSGVSFFVMISVVLPSFVFAKENQGNNSKASKSQGLKLGVNFCSNLSTIEVKLAEQATEKEAKLSKGRAEVGRNQKINHEEGDARIQKNKNRNEEDRDGKYKNIFGKAKTDEQKAAMRVFADAITQATLIRRTAIDTAMATFKSGVDAIMVSRKAEVDAALVVFKTAVAAAIDKAKADCAAGVDAKSTRVTLQASVKIARDQYKDKIKQIEKRGDDFQVLLEAKTKVMKDANIVFKTAVIKAKDALKLALGK